MGILDEGLWAKFEQNEKLATFLFDTGTDIIVEGNKYNSLCSVGLSLLIKMCGILPNSMVKMRWVKH